MADKLWSLIRNFSNTKFYECAQIGALTGAAPFTVGAIFASTPAPISGSIFSNRGSNVGFGLGLVTATGLISVANGTVIQNTGPINDTTGAVLAAASSTGTSQDLANAFASSEENGAASAGFRGSNSPKSSQLAFVALTVPATGSQTLYVNGHVVHNLAVGLATSSANVTIGNDPTHISASASLGLVGVFYHNAVYTAAEMATMFAACAQAKDLVGPSGLRTATDPLYMWSVKRGNFDARASWVSDGSAATPIAMSRNGTWTASGAGSDVIAADMPWMQL
jgi:hypothetical protein